MLFVLVLACFTLGSSVAWLGHQAVGLASLCQAYLQSRRRLYGGVAFERIPTQQTTALRTNAFIDNELDGYQGGLGWRQVELDYQSRDARSAVWHEAPALREWDREPTLDEAAATLPLSLLNRNTYRHSPNATMHVGWVGPAGNERSSADSSNIFRL